MQLITSRDNQVIKETQKLLKHAKHRQEQSKFIIEGVRLCADAVESGLSISTVLLSHQASEKFLELTEKLEEICESTFLISDKLFSQISDTKSPQGVMCICEIPKHTPDFTQKGNYLVLEHIQDPTNMGTILRTAEALGITGVALSQNCCDIYSPKVLRGAMGAVFRVPIWIVDDLQVLTDTFNTRGITTLATVPSANAVDITILTKAQKSSCAIYIGNEGNGLTTELINQCAITTTIPIRGKAESLNASAAASIVMWEILK